MLASIQISIYIYEYTYIYIYSCICVSFENAYKNRAFLYMRPWNLGSTTIVVTVYAGESRHGTHLHESCHTYACFMTRHTPATREAEKDATYGGVA